MSLSRDDVKKIAHLARLGLEESLIPTYESNLSNILEMVETINQAQTEGITPMAHPLEGSYQRLRDDQVSETPDREAFQAIAPQTEAGLYLVPKVIEDQEG